MAHNMDTRSELPRRSSATSRKRKTYSDAVTNSPTAPMKGAAARRANIRSELGVDRLEQDKENVSPAGKFLDACNIGARNRKRKFIKAAPQLLASHVGRRSDETDGDGHPRCDPKKIYYYNKSADKDCRASVDVNHVEKPSRKNWDILTVDPLDLSRDNQRIVAERDYNEVQATSYLPPSEQTLRRLPRDDPLQLLDAYPWLGQVDVRQGNANRQRTAVDLWRGQSGKKQLTLRNSADRGSASFASFPVCVQSINEHEHASCERLRPDGNKNATNNLTTSGLESDNACLNDLSVIINPSQSSADWHEQMSGTGTSLGGGSIWRRGGRFCSTFSYPLHSTALITSFADVTDIEFDASDQSSSDRNDSDGIEAVKSVIDQQSSFNGRSISDISDCILDWSRTPNLHENAEILRRPSDDGQTTEPHHHAGNVFWNKSNNDVLIKLSDLSSAHRRRRPNYKRDFADKCDAGGIVNKVDRYNSSCVGSDHVTRPTDATDDAEHDALNRRRVHRKLRRQVANSRLNRRLIETGEVERRTTVDKLCRLSAAVCLSDDRKPYGAHRLPSDTTSLFDETVRRARVRVHDDRETTAAAASGTTCNFGDSPRFSSAEQNYSCTMVSVDVDLCGSPFFSDFGVSLSSLSLEPEVPEPDQFYQNFKKRQPSLLISGNAAHERTSWSVLKDGANARTTLSDRSLNQPISDSLFTRSRSFINCFRLGVGRYCEAQVKPRDWTDPPKKPFDKDKYLRKEHERDGNDGDAFLRELLAHKNDADSSSLGNRSHLSRRGKQSHSKENNRCYCGPWSFQERSNRTGSSAASSGLYRHHLHLHKADSRKRLRRQSATGDIVVMGRRKVLTRKMQYFRRALRENVDSSSAQLTTFGQV